MLKQDTHAKQQIVKEESSYIKMKQICIIKYIISIIIKTMQSRHGEDIYNAHDWYGEH